MKTNKEKRAEAIEILDKIVSEINIAGLCNGCVDLVGGRIYPEFENYEDTLNWLMEKLK